MPKKPQQKQSMIMNMGMQECDSFEEDDIDHLQAELALVQGPSLSSFQDKQSDPIANFASKDIVKSILDQQGRDIKLIGSDRYSQYHAFFYVLLLIGVEEHKNYPHLNTLIRQQFYKPNIFHDSDQSRAQISLAGSMLEKCLKYFEQIGESFHLEDYFIRQPVFQEAGIIMLRNSVQSDDQRPVYEQLASKFNIDMLSTRQQEHSSCFQFGLNKRLYIIRQHSYFFVSTTEVKEEVALSRMDLESVRSGESGRHGLIEHSDGQSTPKFKNSEVKFRKKSHKNSFGMDMQHFQYKDLVQMHAKKQKNNVKVFSQYCEVNQMESAFQNTIDIDIKKDDMQDNQESEGEKIIKAQMKGSTTLPSHYLGERRKDRKIASSEIIQHRDFSNRLARHDSMPQPPLEHQSYIDQRNAYHSLVQSKDSFQPKMRSSLIQNQRLQRIEEMQSSQKQSTHPDQQSQRSSQPPSDLPPPSQGQQIQVKIKDRKYSYFTQQVASSKSRKQKQIECSNYIFKFPKNLHKNSQVILPDSPQSKYFQHRFQNQLRFSQMGSPSQQSLHQNTTTNHHKTNLRLNSSIYSYFLNSQPQSWYKKQIIYHMNDNRIQRQVFERNIPVPRSDYRSQTCQTRHSQPVSEYFLGRDSFGSSNNSFLSNAKSPQCYSAKQVPQHPKQHNAYEINKNSFLKNRIQSMSQLQPFIQCDQSDDSKSVYFPSSRSLREIKLSPDHAPTKICFNYMSSSPTSQTSTTKKAANYSPFQYKSSHKIKNPPTYSPCYAQVQQRYQVQEGVNSRPQTSHNYSQHFQNRFFRSPNQ